MTINRAIKLARPYKNYFFSLNPLEPDYLQNLGFSITLRPKTNCTALVIWGSPYSLGSSVGFGKFSLKIKSSIQLPPYILGVIIGLILSDAWVQISKSKNARLRFSQSLVHFEYLWYVFLILS